MTGRRDRRIPFFRLVAGLALAVFLAAGQGCHWGRQEAAAPPPAPAPAPQEPSAPAEAPGIAGPPAAPAEAPGIGEPPSLAAGETTGPGVGEPAPSPPSEVPEAVELPATPPSADLEPPQAAPEKGEPGEETAAAAPSGSAPVTGALRAEPALPAGDEPFWARGREELVYRVEFLGVTMGYARFTFMGKAMLGARETYHLNVRAWTSGILSVIYPVNETIDYYLDVTTLAPLRQDFSKMEREKDNIAYYHQDTGTIVYRYKHNGSIRKKVEAAPNVYDPVSAAYYFRVRDLGMEDRPRNVYAGRKLWQISCRTLGVERLSTPLGQVETVVVQPVIKREGKLENKGDLRMWMTNDARHVPVRFYAKFKKIRVWTLVGELMPRQERG